MVPADRTGGPEIAGGDRTDARTLYRRAAAVRRLSSVPRLGARTAGSLCRPVVRAASAAAASFQTHPTGRLDASGPLSVATGRRGTRASAGGLAPIRRENGEEAHEQVGKARGRVKE